MFLIFRIGRRVLGTINTCDTVLSVCVCDSVNVAQAPAQYLKGIGRGRAHPTDPVWMSVRIIINELEPASPSPFGCNPGCWWECSILWIDWHIPPPSVPSPSLSVPLHSARSSSSPSPSLSPTFDFLLNVSEHANSTCHLSFNYFSLHTANHTARSLAGHTETHTHSAATLADRLRTAKWYRELSWDHRRVPTSLTPPPNNMFRNEFI